MKYKVNITNLVTFAYDVVNMTANYPLATSGEGFFLEVDDEKLYEELKKQNNNIQKLFFDYMDTINIQLTQEEIKEILSMIQLKLKAIDGYNLSIKTTLCILRMKLKQALNNL